jgi:micrococcal nuclease
MKVYMKKLFFVVLMAFSGFAAASDMRFPFVSVTDGDTIRSSIQVACPLCNVYIRIRGIDTPESNYLAKCPLEKERGLAAKKYLQTMFEGKKEFMARNIAWDKYGGRILGDVEIDGKKVADEMIKAGHAKPYSGRGRKPDWCI